MDRTGHGDWRGTFGYMGQAESDRTWFLGWWILAKSQANRVFDWPDHPPVAERCSSSSGSSPLPVDLNETQRGGYSTEEASAWGGLRFRFWKVGFRLLTVGLAGAIAAAVYGTLSTPLGIAAGVALTILLLLRWGYWVLDNVPI